MSRITHMHISSPYIFIYLRETNKNTKIKWTVKFLHFNHNFWTIFFRRLEKNLEKIKLNMWQFKYLYSILYVLKSEILHFSHTHIYLFCFFVSKRLSHWNRKFIQPHVEQTHIRWLKLLILQWILIDTCSIRNLGSLIKLINGYRTDLTGAKKIFQWPNGKYNVMEYFLALFFFFRLLTHFKWALF